MGLNAMGVGFSFGAKDAGMNRFLKGALTNMDNVSAAIRGFGVSAEKATAPMDNLVQSMSAKAFNAIADAGENVTNVLQKGVYETILRGSNIIERAKKKYIDAGHAIDLSFQNLGGSIQGVYDLLVGDRLKKFAESIPVDRFKKMADKMRTTKEAAKHFASTVFGDKKSVAGFNESLAAATPPLQALGEKMGQECEKANGLTNCMEDLSKATGKDLGDNARKGAEKFKRASDQNVSSEHAIAAGVALISERLGGMDKNLQKSSGGIKKFMGLFSLKNLADIGHGLANVGHSGGELTTSFEATAQAASVASRKVIAATGIFGKELTDATAKATGLSMGMKVSEQTAGNAVATMKQFGGELKAFGIDSVETGIKLEDGLGVPIRDLGFNVKKMRDGLHLSDKDLNEVAGSFTATGEAIHDMVHPLQNMPQLLELAQRRANLVAQGMSSIGGKDSIKSMNRAIQSLFVLTGDAKGAQEGAVALEQKMVESMENFRNMFAGTSTELDSFLVNTSVVTGDVKNAFAAAQQGPDAFIKEFSGVIAKLKKDGKKTSEILQFFGGQMSEALGPELANTLITALASADEAKVKTMKGLKDMGKGLGAVAKESWRSSMTMQESFDLMMGAAESRFRSIGRVAAQTFVTDTGKAFGKFNDNAERLVKEGGPLGKMVEKMSEISSLGAKALLPKALRPIAQIFSHMGPMVFQAVSAFSALVPVLMTLGGPAGILIAMVATLAAVYLGFKQIQAHLHHIGPEWKDATAAVAKYEKQLKNTKVGTEQYAEISKKLAEAKAKVADLKPIKKLNDEEMASQKAMAALQKKLHSFKGSKQSKQYQELTKAIEAERKKQAAIEAEFDKEAKARATKAMKEKLEAIVQTIKDNIPLIVDALSGIWDIVGPLLGKAFDAFEMWLGGVIVMAVEGWGMIISDAWKDFTKWLSGVIDDAEKWLGDFFGPMVFAVSDGIANMIAKINRFVTDVEDAFMAGFKAVYGFLKQYLWDPIAGFFTWIGDTVDSMFGHSTVVDAFARGFKEIQTVVETFWGIVKGIFGEIMSFAGKLFEPVLKIVDKIFSAGADSVPNLIKGGMDKAKAIMEEATKAVTSMVEEAFQEAVTEGLTMGFLSAFKKIMEATRKFFTSEAEMFAKFTDDVTKRFNQMWVNTLNDSADAVDALGKTIGSAMSQLAQLEVAIQHLQDVKKTVADEQKKAQEAQAGAKPAETGLPSDAVRVGLQSWWGEDRAAKDAFADWFGALTQAIANLSTKPTAGTAGGGPARKAAEGLSKTQAARPKTPGSGTAPAY